MSEPVGVHVLAGNWSGIDRLWFEPGPPANRSEAVLAIRPTLGGRAVVIDHRWTMAPGTAEAEEHLGTFLVTPVGEGTQVAWIDTFGTGGTIMALGTGALAAAGLAAVAVDPMLRTVGQDGADGEPFVDALGSYDGDGVSWGWRLQIARPDHDTLVIAEWNVTPGGEEQLALLGEYHRDVDPHDEVTV
jgi:Protein of unknown function (DUF1579)